MKDFPIPQPRKIVKTLPHHIRRSLLSARLTPNGYRVSWPIHGDLKAYGLVDHRESFLSAFGIGVMKYLTVGNMCG